MTHTVHGSHRMNPNDIDELLIRYEVDVCVCVRNFEWIILNGLS